MTVKLTLTDPKSARMPKETGIGGRLKPMRRVPLVNPDTFIEANPRLSGQLQKLNPIQPAEIRQDLKERLQQAVTKVNRHIETANVAKNIRFAVHEDSGYYFATVTNKETGEVLKTVPAQNMLDLAARLQDASGLFQDITI